MRDRRREKAQRLISQDECDDEFEVLPQNTKKSYMPKHVTLFVYDWPGSRLGVRSDGFRHRLQVFKQCDSSGQLLFVDVGE